MKNLEKCLHFMGDANPKQAYNKVILGINTEEELMFKLNLLPEATKNVIISKWGLDDTKLCTTFKSLDSKLDVSNSRELYTLALFDLSRTAYLVSVGSSGEMYCIFKDYSSIDFTQAVQYARLRRAVLGEIKPFDGTLQEFVAIVDDAFSTLTERENTVLKLRFGFVDGTPKLLEEVGKEFCVTRERIRQIEAKALRKLRHPSRHIVPAPARPVVSTVSTINKDATSIDEIGFTVRTYNCLVRSGCTTVEDFLKLSEEDLIRTRNLGRKGFEECMTAQAKLREK